MFNQRSEASLCLNYLELFIRKKVHCNSCCFYLFPVRTFRYTNEFKAVNKLTLQIAKVK